MLTKADLETPRTAATMLPWVLATMNGFATTRELKAAALQGQVFFNELRHEALPIALFAHRYYEGSADVTITHAIGSQQYDAIVDDRRQNPAPVQYIETTVSDHDYTESLREEILSRDGRVPAYTDVQAEGPKGRRTHLAARSMAVSHDGLREQHLRNVIEVVKKKVEKKYPDGTALVVHVDDYTPFREGDDIEALGETALAALVPLLSGREFRVLALEGTRCVHLCWELS